MTITIDLPVALIGLDPRPQRQIRPLNLEHVRALMEMSQPDDWDPIEVRPWPTGDPYPPGEEGRTFQVISGYHRTTAARNLGLKTIRGIIITEPLDDLAFQLRTFRSNARHGKLMSADEKQSLARRLRSTDLDTATIRRYLVAPDDGDDGEV